jgi:hypothetical protein
MTHNVTQYHGEYYRKILVMLSAINAECRYAVYRAPGGRKSNLIDTNSKAKRFTVQAPVKGTRYCG